MSHLTVIWDGRRTGPGGAQLFTEEGPVVPMGEPVDRRPNRGAHTGSFDKVRMALPSFNGAWFTKIEMVIRARVEERQAASALHHFMKQGVLETHGVRPMRYRVKR